MLWLLQFGPIWICLSSRLNCRTRTPWPAYFLHSLPSKGLLHALPPHRGIGKPPFRAPCAATFWTGLWLAHDLAHRRSGVPLAIMIHAMSFRKNQNCRTNANLFVAGKCLYRLAPIARGEARCSPSVSVLRLMGSHPCGLCTVVVSCTDAATRPIRRGQTERGARWRVRKNNDPASNVAAPLPCRILVCGRAFEIVFAEHVCRGNVNQGQEQIDMVVHAIEA
jgi:hypothetical protein